MIDVKEAVQIAKEYIQDIYDQELTDLMLEEVEYSEQDDQWLITFGFTRPQPTLVQSQQDPLERLKSPTVTREYKVFAIRAKDGKVLSMKIREI